MEKKLKLHHLAGGTINQKPPIFTENGEFLLFLSNTKIKVFSPTTGELVRELKRGRGGGGEGGDDGGGESPLVDMVLDLDDPEIITACSESGELFSWFWRTGELKENVKIPLMSADRCGILTNFHLINWYGKSSRKCYGFICQKITNQEIKWHVIERNTGNTVHVRSNLRLGMKRPLLVVDNKNFPNIVLVQGFYVFFVNYKTWTYRRLKNAHQIPVTTVQIHPQEKCVATGDEIGRIYLWRNFHDHTTVCTSMYHWHHTMVTSIAFTPSGANFYSGGQEGVMVNWRVEHPDQRHYLPRMVSRIRHIVVSPNNTQIAVSMVDNGVQIIGTEKKIYENLQEFTFIPDDKTGKCKFPVGLRLNPRTNTMVLNGRTGCLQFYNTHTKTLLYNFNVVNENVLSMERDRILYDTCVTRAAFHMDWMATGEEFNDEQRMPEIRLKFWFYQEEKRSYTLNTCIELPHEGGFCSIEFSNPLERENLLCGTVGKDNYIKIWYLDESDDIYRNGKTWYCGAKTKFTGNHRIEDISFSYDGSILAAGYDDHLCLYKSDTLKLCSVLTCSRRDDCISKVQINISENADEKKKTTRKNDRKMMIKDDDDENDDDDDENKKTTTRKDRKMMTMDNDDDNNDNDDDTSQDMIIDNDSLQPSSDCKEQFLQLLNTIDTIEETNNNNDDDDNDNDFDKNLKKLMENVCGDKSMESEEEEEELDNSVLMDEDNKSNDDDDDVSEDEMDDFNFEKIFSKNDDDDDDDDEEMTTGYDFLSNEFNSIHSKLQNTERVAIFDQVMNNDELNFTQKVLIFQRLGICGTLQDKFCDELKKMLNQLNVEKQYDELELELCQLNDRERYQAALQFYEYKRQRSKYDEKMNNDDYLMPLSQVISLQTPLPPPSPSPAATAAPSPAPRPLNSGGGTMSHHGGSSSNTLAKRRKLTNGRSSTTNGGGGQRGGGVGEMTNGEKDADDNDDGEKDADDNDDGEKDVDDNDDNNDDDEMMNCSISTKRGEVESRIPSHSSIILPPIMYPSRIHRIEFCRGEFSHLIICCTETRIFLWNVRTLRLEATFHLTIRHFSYDPLTNLMAVISKDQQLIIFSLELLSPIAIHNNLPELYGMLWIPRRRPKSTVLLADWQAKSTLYYLTQNQEIKYFVTSLPGEEEEEREEEQLLVNIRDDEGQQQEHPLYSTFGTIPNQRVVEEDPNNSTMMNAIDGPLILKKTHKDAVKMLIDMSIHTMPSTSRLRDGFLEAMLQKIDSSEFEGGVESSGTGKDNNNSTTLKMVDRKRSVEEMVEEESSRRRSSSPMKHNGDAVMRNGFSRTSRINDDDESDDDDDSDEVVEENRKLRKAICHKKDELKAAHKNRTTTIGITTDTNSGQEEGLAIEDNRNHSTNTANLQHLINRKFYYDF